MANPRGQAITLTVEQAEQILELYRNTEAADAHFKNCQSDIFRQHMRGVYQAPLVESAFKQLGEAVEKAKS